MRSRFLELVATLSPLDRRKITLFVKYYNDTYEYLI